MRSTSVLIPALVLLAAGCGQPGRSSAQTLQGGFGQPDRAPPAGAVQMRMSFAPVVKRAAPAVVNVYARRIVRQQVDPFWELFGAGVPRQRVEQSLGSGVLVRSDGVVVTNNHVIEGGQEIMVVLSDRREFPAKVLLADARADVAVLKIDPGAERLPVLPIDDSDNVQIGDLVLAIGNPFGVGQTVTNGIVSAKARTNGDSADYNYFIQTDAAINPGNSGGPLVDMDGDLIGLNSSILSRSGTSTGVGFAIPAAIVKQVVEAALGGAHAVVRPWLGVKGQTVTGEIASSLGLPRPEGVLVQAVYPGSAADKAGVKSGDLIVSVDGQEVDDEAALAFRIGAHHPGDQASLEVRRAGASRTVSVRAEPAPATPARDERTIDGRNPLAGATVVNLSPAVAEELGADAFAAKGVLVTKIADGALAANVGLRPGDLVRQINGRPINTVSDIQPALAAGAGAWRLVIQRGDQVISGDFRL